MKIFPLAMFSASDLSLFFAASVALIATPGPAVVFICARSVDLGTRAGVVTAASIGAGNLGHALAAAFGMAAVFASSEVAYWGVRYAGAAYLVYLGVARLMGGRSGRIRWFRRRAGRSRSVESEQETSARGAGAPLGGMALFRDGLLVGLLNPKVALFLVAFLPQFADPERGAVWLQLLTLGIAFMAMGLVGDVTYALLSGSLGSLLKRQGRWRRVGRALSGTTLIALGALTAVGGW